MSPVDYSIYHLLPLQPTTLPHEISRFGFLPVDESYIVVVISNTATVAIVQRYGFNSSTADVKLARRASWLQRVHLCTPRVFWNHRSQHSRQPPWKLSWYLRCSAKPGEITFLWKTWRFDLVHHRVLYGFSHFLMLPLREIVTKHYSNFNLNMFSWT